MPKVLKTIWDEFVYGGHLIALGPVFIVVIGGKLANFHISFWLYLIAYLFTFSIYAFDRYIDLNNEPLDSQRIKIRNRARFTPYLIFIYALTSISLSAIQGIAPFLIILIIFLLSFGYALFFKKASSKIPGFKSFFVAILYTFSLVFAAVYENHAIDISVILLSLFFFFRNFSNASFCDIKDINSDKDKGLKTLAVILTRKRLDMILIIANVLSIIPILIGIYLKLLPLYSALLILTIPYFIYYNFILNRENSDMQKLSYLWADGEMLLWFSLVFIGGLI